MAGVSAALSAPPAFRVKMVDRFILRRTVLFVALCAAAMAVLLPCLALVRDTTAHDWYAARKLTLAEVMIATGFDRYAVTEYRTPDGTTMRITRGGLALYGEPIHARERIVSTVGNHTALGAGAAFAVLCMVLISGTGVLQGHRARMRRTTAAAGPRAHPGAWGGPGFIADRPPRDGGGERIGLLVVSPTEIEGGVEVYGPVAISGPLPAGRFVQAGTEWNEDSGRLAPGENAPALTTTPALQAGRQPGAAAQPSAAKADTDAAAPPAEVPTTAEIGGARQRREPSRPVPQEKAIAGDDGAAVREPRNPARPKAGKGGSGLWF